MTVGKWTILILFCMVSTLVANVNNSLLEAAKNGDLGSFRDLLKQGANTWAWDDSYRRPVHLAVEYGHMEILQYLVSIRSDLNLQDKNGWTALHYAAREGNLKALKYLAESGADIEARDILNETPLFIASYKGKFDIVQYLVDKGASVYNRDIQGNTLLHQAAYKGNNKIVDYFWTRHMDINSTNFCGWTPLHRAVYGGRTETVRLLITLGAFLQPKTTDTWKQFPKGSTPYDFAVIITNRDIMKYLENESNAYNR